MRKKFLSELSGIYDRGEISRFTEVFLREWKGWNRADAYLYRDLPLDADLISRLKDALEQLKRNRPIQYIIGKTLFCGIDFLVGPGVLIPRPETEELVSMIIRENQGKIRDHTVIMDIGTGTGCIAISLKKRFPASEVWALDSSEKALGYAKKNASDNNCRVHFVRYDILSGKKLPELPGFLIIVSNPPYVTESEREMMHRNILDHEPQEALFVPDHDPLLFYRSIAAFASEKLSHAGTLYLEINERYGEEVRVLLLSNKFDPVEVLKDINGKERFVKACR